MPAEILDQLKTLREGIAEALRKDPRFLTLNALDKSIVEIGGVLGGSVQTHPAPMQFTPAAVATPAAPAMPLGAVPTDGSGTLEHIKALREGIVTAIRKDPRYLTLSALDRSIAEIGGVLGGSSPGIEAEAMGKPLGHAATTHAAPTSAVDEGEPGEDPDPPGSNPHAPPDAPVAPQGFAAPQDVAANHSASIEAEPHAAPMIDAAETSVLSTEDQEPVGLAPAEHDAAVEPEVIHPPAPAVGDALHSDPVGALPVEAHEELPHNPALHDPAFHDPAPHDPASMGQQDWDDLEAASHGSGYKPMAARPDAAIYQPTLGVKFGRLPHRVDLRPLMSPVETQGEIKSCVADAVTAALELWLKRASRHETALSRLFVYYNARWRDGVATSDGGSAIQLTMEAIAKFGACLDQVWPFDTHLTLKKPGAEAYKDAAGHRVQDMARVDIARVPLRLEAWKQALAEGKPIVFGCLLFASFGECPERGGIVPMPPPEEVAHAEHGAHAMCVVGFCDAEQVFIVRNCWGAEWGDEGHCYMPYAYLMNPKFNDGDCWVFVPKLASQPPREVWSDATAPVTNAGQGVDFAIEPYTIADYETVAVDLFAPIRNPFNATIPPDYADYVAMVGKSRWSDLESFDVATYLAVAAALDPAGDDFASETLHEGA